MLQRPWCLYGQTCFARGSHVLIVSIKCSMFDVLFCLIVFLVTVPSRTLTMNSVWVFEKRAEDESNPSPRWEGVIIRYMHKSYVSVLSRNYQLFSLIPSSLTYVSSQLSSMIHYTLYGSSVL